MEHDLCKALGMDQKYVKDRLRLLELGSGDAPLIDKMHRFVIGPHLDELIDKFYEYILSHPEYRAFVNEATVIAKLTRTFKTYLETLGMRFDTLGYFQDRLRVGIAHHRIGMPLVLYECSYRKLQQLLLDKIPRELNEELLREISSIIHKIVSLDISLAIDSYNMEIVNDLKEEISQHSHKEEQFKRYASIDPLTRIVNRGALINKLKGILKDQDNALNYSLLMIDINNMSDINNRFGHLVGDFLIKKVVEKIQHCIPKASVFGRYGGDEFMIVLKDVRSDEARSIAEHISDTVGEYDFDIGNQDLKVTLCQGVTELNQEKSLAENIKIVDRAMIDAKNIDKPNIVVT